MLLCDAASVSEGKLYILGAGWNLINLAFPNAPTNMAIAITIQIPWDEANRPHHLEVELVTEDGQPFGDGLKLEGDVEVGRPAGLHPGTTLTAPMAFNLNGLLIAPGGYEWRLRVGTEQLARTSFRVNG
jgi:hypothetical protein